MITTNWDKALICGYHFTGFTFVHTKIMAINILTYESQWYILIVDTKSALVYIKEKAPC